MIGAAKLRKEDELDADHNQIGNVKRIEVTVIGAIFRSRTSTADGSNTHDVFFLPRD